MLSSRALNLIRGSPLREAVHCMQPTPSSERDHWDAQGRSVAHMMSKRLLLALPLSLALAVPVMAQSPRPAVEMPPPGTVVVMLYVYDGVSMLPAGTGVVPPIACAP